MNNIIITVIVIGGLYTCFEIGYAIGKGITIGNLCKCRDPHAEYILNLLNNHKTLSGRFVGKIANLVKK